MPRIESRSLVWAVAATVGLWAFLGQGQNASAYTSYSGLWEARENDQGRILQKYAHLFSVNLAQDLSDRLTSRENVNYTYQWEQEVGLGETASPGASLALNSELFLANLAVNSVRNLRSRSGQPDSDTVGVNWTSSWQKSFVPDLRFNYDQSRSKTDQIDQTRNDGRKDYGAEVKWDLRLVQAMYTYRKDEFDYTNYQTNQDSQMARVNAGQAWLDNRLRIDVGHEYNQSHSETLITAPGSVQIAIFSAFTGVESFPGSPTVVDSLLASPALIDNNLLGSAYSVPVSPPSSCIRLQNNTNDAVELIYLYNNNSIDNLVSNPATVTWRLYYNNALFAVNPWTLVPGISVTYEPANQRFVMVVPKINANYLKVVVDRGVAAPSLNITEVKAYKIYTASGVTGRPIQSTNKTNRSNFSLDYKLNKSVGFYYNFLMSRDETNSDIMNENVTHNGGARLQNAAGDLRSNISYSLSKIRYKDTPEEQTKVYLVDINKVFLPTLTVALSGSREESSQDGAAISDRYRYTFYTDAKLYPDLTSRLEVTYWTQNSYHPGLASNKWDDFRTQLTVTSRFRPSLVVSFVDIYEVQNQDSKLMDKKNSSSLSGSWQLSELCSLNGSVQNEESQVNHSSYVYALGMVVGLGSGLEFKANYSLSDSVTTSQSGNASLLWRAHQNLSWEVGCDYAETDEAANQNVYKVYSKLLVSFATR